MRLDLRHLDALQAIADRKSLTLAAHDLGVTQPAISIQMKKLEHELGVSLFERVGRGVELTEAGREVLQHARRIGRVVEDLRENLRQYRELGRGELRIAVVSTANYFISDHIARFRKDHPGVGINLFVANLGGVFNLIEANEADLAITGRPPEDAEFVAQRFMQNPLGIIAPPDHPLVGRADLAPQDLLDYPFVFREPGSGTRAAMERAFHEHGLECRASCVLSTNEAVKQAVQAGLGIAVISKQTIELEVVTGRLALIECSGLSLMRQWFLAYRNFRRLPPAALSFRNQLLSNQTTGA